MSIKENNLENLIKGVMRHGPDVLEYTITEDSALHQYVDRIQNERLNYPIPAETINANNWFMPKEYQNLDIEEFLVNQCPKENYNRLVEELTEYKKRNLIPLLKQMKYIVDTLRKNNVVWGVGRGSSVASYCLFLIGVHKVDSVKYNLPIEEFFKEI